MSKYMPLTLLLPLVLACALALVVSSVAVSTAKVTAGPSPLIPVSWCFTTIILVCVAVARVNKRVVDLEQQLAQLLPKADPPSTTQTE